MSGEAMQRVVTLSKRQQQQQQQQLLKQQQHTQGNTGHSCTARSVAPWADSLEEGGLDWGAPFALSSGVEEGAHDSRSLETLMRILEKREPSFLMEDDGVVGGGRGVRRDVGCGGVEGLFDSDLDCLLSMPAASDLTVVSLFLARALCLSRAPSPSLSLSLSLSFSLSFFLALFLSLS